MEATSLSSLSDTSSSALINVRGTDRELLLLVGVFSEAVVHSSDDEEPAASSAVAYGADVPADLAARNRADRGRAPGMDRTREVVLVPVGISTILLSLEGVLGVANDLVGALLDDPELGVPPPTAPGLPA